MPTLLVNADDFGLHGDINRGIADCVRAGAIQSVSICPVGKALDWCQVRSFSQSGVRIGIHLTLVGEPWGTNGRVFPDWKEFARTVLTGGVRFQHELIRETRWQFDCVTKRQIPLSHVDSHQHVHMLPSVFGCVKAAAKELGILRMRIPFCPHGSLIRKSAGGIALQALARYRWRGHGSRMACIGIRRAGHNTAETLALELKTCAAHAPWDLELIAHPGVSTPELMQSYSSWNFDWTGERDALLSSQFKMAVASAGYKFADVSTPAL